MDTKNQPEKQFKVGGVCVAIWRTERTDGNGEKYDTRHVTLDRAFKETDGNWKHTGSMRVNDIPKATLALQKAFEYLTCSGKSTDNEEE